MAGLPRKNARGTPRLLGLGLPVWVGYAQGLRTCGRLFSLPLYGQFDSTHFTPKSGIPLSTSNHYIYWFLRGGLKHLFFEAAKIVHGHLGSRRQFAIDIIAHLSLLRSSGHSPEHLCIRRRQSRIRGGRRSASREESIRTFDQ